MSDEQSMATKSVVLDEEKRKEMAVKILATVGGDLTKLPAQLNVALENAMEIDPNLSATSDEEKISSAIAVALDTDMMSLEEISAITT